MLNVAAVDATIIFYKPQGSLPSRGVRSMPPEKVEAIVLRTYNLTESSKIVVLLTPSRGKVRAVAKGIRRAKSKFGSALEPMTHIETQLYFKENRELQTLSQGVTCASFPAIRSDLTRLGLASVMCELMEQFVQENDESSRAFVLLLVSLNTLASMSKNYSSLLISFYLKTLEISGLAPGLESCAGCGKKLDKPAYLDAGAGGALCAGCSAGMGERIAAGSIKIMQRLLSVDWTMLERVRVPASSADEILRALGTYVSYHTGRELRSSKFLRSVSNLK
jgi:DNA repair protein RecO (recombination protein O)